MSLRARLLAGMSFVALALGVVAVVITTTTRNQLMDQADARLESFSASFPGGGTEVPAFPGGELPQPPPGGLERLSDVYQGWVDETGTLRGFVPNTGGDGSPPDLSGVNLPTSGRALFTVESEGGGTTYRVLATALPSGVAITGLPIDDVEATINRLVLVAVLGALAILAALGLVSWWVVRLGIRPIKDVTRAATEIAAGDLSVRVPDGAPGTETAELAVALNGMLGHIEGAIAQRAESEDRLRRFVADASHELRTPVTTIRGYSELYRLGGLGDDDALGDAMRRTEQEAARMGRLVDDMLTLARLDEERPLEMKPVDLVQLVSDATSDARAASPGRPIAVDVPIAPAIIRGDEDRLRQVLANVVGNALVHTEADVPITLRVLVDEVSVTVSVDDEGPGMPSTVAGRATERFYRADPARSRHRGGSGLGLSIVEAAVAAHGGSTAIDSEPGRGTTIRLVLPRLAGAD